MYFNMSEDIKERINKVNEDFYKIIFESFDETRRSFWDAWNIIFKNKKIKKEINVLDLGCGNGRFAEFLNDNLDKDIKINYIGIDSSEELMNLGKKHLEKIENNNFKFEFFKKNIIEDELIFENKKFDFIVLFGVMHHIYDSNVRINLFKKIKKLLKEDGEFIFTTWQFLNNERQNKKILNLESEEGEKFLDKFNLEKNDFKKDDYILSWERQKKAYRYCHNYSEKEVDLLLEKTEFEKKESFFADGKEGNLNQYFIVR